MKRRDLLKGLSGFSVLPFVDWSSLLKSEKLVTLIDYSVRQCDSFGYLHRRYLWNKGQLNPLFHIQNYIPWKDNELSPMGVNAVNAFPFARMRANGRLVVDFYDYWGSKNTNVFDSLCVLSSNVKRYAQKLRFYDMHGPHDLQCGFIRCEFLSNSWRVVQSGITHPSKTLGYFDKDGFVKCDCEPPPKF